MLEKIETVRRADGLAAHPDARGGRAYLQFLSLLPKPGEGGRWERRPGPIGPLGLGRSIRGRIQSRGSVRDGDAQIHTGEIQGLHLYR